jgi:hypothetical protein
VLKCNHGTPPTSHTHAHARTAYRIGGRQCTTSSLKVAWAVSWDGTSCWRHCSRVPNTVLKCMPHGWVAVALEVALAADSARSSRCLCLCGGQKRAAYGVKSTAAQRVGHTNVRQRKVGRGLSHDYPVSPPRHLTTPFPIALAPSHTRSLAPSPFSLSCSNPPSLHLSLSSY